MFMKWSMENLFVNQKKNTQKWYHILWCASSILCLMVTSCSLLPQEEQEEKLPEITRPAISKKPEHEVKKELWISKVPSSGGKIMSEQEETFFFTLEKPVKKVLIKNGDNVKSGQVLVVLDTDEMQKELRRKRLQHRKEEVKMKEILQKKDEMNAVEFEETKQVYEESRQTIAELEEDIRKASIIAPFTGTVVELKAKKGHTPKKYDPVITVANTSRLAVALEIPKEDIKRIAPGMEVELNVTTVEKMLHGKVKSLPVPSTDNNQRNHNEMGDNEQPEQDKLDNYVIVSLRDQLPATVTRGMPLSASVITQKRQHVITIPPSALRTLGNRTYVQVVAGTSKKEVDVEVGERDATRVEIKAGLVPGQKVVGR